MRQYIEHLVLFQFEYKLGMSGYTLFGWDIVIQKFWETQFVMMMIDEEIFGLHFSFFRDDDEKNGPLQLEKIACNGFIAKPGWTRMHLVVLIENFNLINKSYFTVLLVSAREPCSITYLLSHSRVQYKLYYIHVTQPIQFFNSH